VPLRGPRRPGQVVTAAVLALVQAALVAFASAYVLLFASFLGIDVDSDGTIDPRAADIADEAQVLAWIQFASVVALVAAGVLALNRRDRGTWLALLGALAVQVLLALYWAVRIVGVLQDLPGPDDGAVGILVFFAVVFAAGPAVGLGLGLARASREWFGVDRGGVRS
jgi:cytochrome bd-type quinol oxidase subunit 2